MILASFANAACAHAFGRRGSFSVPVYAFDFAKARLYHGKKEDPTDSIPLADQEKIERELHMVCTPFDSWQHLRRSCGIGKATP